MIDDALKLTVYFGERDRARGGFLADALCDIAARHELRTSLVLRGVEGFGAKHRLRTDRLLTLSEDLPLVAVAVDARERIEAAHAEVEALAFEGLVTLERARMLGDRLESTAPHEQAKLTVYLGRGERAGGRPAHEAVVETLHRRGVAGATVLLGVDGTAHGVRHRARFFGPNAKVPLMVISVGDGDRLTAALPELEALLEQPLVTLERVQVCKRDGELLAAPAPGDAPWQKLMVYARDPLPHRLLRALRATGAAGATNVRGIWGYHGDHRPHGDTLWQLRRRAPVVTVLVDTPARIAELFAVVDELTGATGLVTSELVPAAQARFFGAQR